MVGSLRHGIEQGAPHRTPNAGTALHQRVERGQAACINALGRLAGEQVRSAERAQIDDLIADRHAAAKRFA